MNPLLLTGLDGSNPLAFLAALGTLRTATNIWRDHNIKMAWKPLHGAWRAVLIDVPEEDSLSAKLADFLKRASPEPFELSRKFPFEAALFREQAASAQQKAAEFDHIVADFIAAYGCEALMEENGNFVETAFRMLRSADSGGSGMLAYAKKLAQTTTASEIERSLFSPWGYADAPPSLRWDPVDDRRYALRWDNPSTDVIRTERGANRLAIEALPMFPTSPVNGNLVTTGFTGISSRDTFLSWPIWTEPVSLNVLRSVLALAELQQAQPDRHVLLSRGIVEIYRSQRITVGKFRNFTPAQPA